MLEQKFPTAFPLKHQQKDMRLALELARQKNQHMLTAAAANALYEQVSCAGRPYVPLRDLL